MKTFILLIALLSVAGLYFVFQPFPFGGLSSRYAVQSQDPFLTAQASTSRPIILAARKYIQDHGHAPTKDELKAHLLEKMNQAQQSSGDWISQSHHGPLGAWLYFPDEKGFSLYLKLGWDPALLYEESTIDQGKWIFDPGDGSAQKELDLKIEF